MTDLNTEQTKTDRTYHYLDDISFLLEPIKIKKTPLNEVELALAEGVRDEEFNATYRPWLVKKEKVA